MLGDISFIKEQTKEKKGRKEKKSRTEKKRTVEEETLIFFTCPCLRKGVGIPIEKRSKIASSLLANSIPITEKEKKRQLLECVRTFLLLQKMEEFAPIILSRNLPGNSIRFHKYFVQLNFFADIFSALVQLLHEPEEESGTNQLADQEKKEY